MRIVAGERIADGLLALTGDPAAPYKPDPLAYPSEVVLTYLALRLCKIPETWNESGHAAAILAVSLAEPQTKLAFLEYDRKKH